MFMSKALSLEFEREIVPKKNKLKEK